MGKTKKVVYSVTVEVARSYNENSVYKVLRDYVFDLHHHKDDWKSVEVWPVPQQDNAVSAPAIPQQPLCGSEASPKLPSFDSVKEAIGFDWSICSRNFKDGARLAYLTIEKLGNFTKR